MPPSTIRHISTSTITPLRTSEVHPRPSRSWELTPWDVAMLSVHYIQKGLLFHTSSSQNYPSNPTIFLLKHSLSQALAHFFPLAGRLKTNRSSSSSSSSLHVFVDCNDLGAEFIHAAADVTVSDVLDPIDIPQIVKSFFVFDGAVNWDGHSIPLLAVQVTELIDGIFIGCSFNHMVGDGTSFWNFFNAWSEIARRSGGEGGDSISNPPIMERWFGGVDPSLVRLRVSGAEEFIERFEAPVLRERFFHFSAESMARLKEKANEECTSNKISSFQALSALVWRSITRARKLPPNQNINCRLAIGNRPRLWPPLSPHYFGNSMQSVAATATTAQLLSHDLGWAAWMVHQSVAGHTDAVARGFVDGWVKSQFVYHTSHFDVWSVMMGSSPRFNMYGNDFGFGTPVAVRSGYANKFDGKVSSYPGREGGGSVDLEICLLPEFMNTLELDDEFMGAVSHSMVS